MIKFLRNCIDKGIRKNICSLTAELDKIDKKMNKNNINQIEIEKEINDVKNRIKRYSENKKYMIDFNIFYTLVLALVIPNILTDVVTNLLTLNLKVIFSLDNIVSVTVSLVLILIYLVFSYSMQLMNGYLSELESYLLRIEIKHDTIIIMNNVILNTNTNPVNLKIKKLYINKIRKVNIKCT